MKRPPANQPDETGGLEAAFALGARSRPGATRKPAPVDEAVLAQCVATARREWPFTLEPAAFVQYLGERVAPEALAKAPLADLYLACAGLQHDPKAIRELGRLLDRECQRVAARHRGSVNAADLSVDLHASLLVGERPRLAEYSGRGSLGGWLAAIAVRAGLRTLRESDRRNRRESGAMKSEATLADPELDLLRKRSRSVFNEVFQEVLNSLDSKERALLRLHVVEGLGLDRLARLKKIGRSTAARWLADLRGKLLSETRRLLAERLSIGTTTLDTLLPALSKDLDVSIRSMLGATTSH